SHRGAPTGRRRARPLRSPGQVRPDTRSSQVRIVGPVRLDRLLGQVNVLETRGDPAGVDVRAIAFNAAEVVPGALYCCLPGSRFDGHDFAPDAVAAGASALLCERMLPLAVVQFRVAAGRVRAGMAQVSAAFNAHPATA